MHVDLTLCTHKVGLHGLCEVRLCLRPGLSQDERCEARCRKRAVTPGQHGPRPLGPGRLERGQKIAPASELGRVGSRLARLKAT
jgi:hypothetical protein